MQGHFRRLIVPVMGVTDDTHLLDVVGQLVYKQAVTITLIYVVEVLQSMPLDAELPVEIERGERMLGVAEERARRNLGQKNARIQTELLQARSAGAAIVDEAIERDVDAVVLAANIRHKHGRDTLGDTVNYVLLNAPCEVIVVRRAMSGRDARGEGWA